MARITVKELQEQLKKRDDLIEWQEKKIQKLQKENERILSDKDVVSKAEFETLTNRLSMSEDSHKNALNLYKNTEEKNRTLINKCIELEKQLKELQLMEQKKHNERGAGRKSSLTQEQINKIKELHEQGLSYGAIAKEAGLSKAYVYKLINKRENCK